MNDAYNTIMDLVSEYGVACQRVYSEGTFNGDEYSRSLNLHKEICEKVLKISHPELKF